MENAKKTIQMKAEHELVETGETMIKGRVKNKKLPKSVNSWKGIDALRTIAVERNFL